MPFGFLGSFTDNRDVLLLTENGGKFAHTKKYYSRDNLRTCSSHFDIDSSGTAEGVVQTFYQGLQYDDNMELLIVNHDEQKKYLYKNNLLPSPQINSFSIVNNKNELPSAIVTESIESRNYGSFSGKYMLLPLNRINVQRPIQKMLKGRHSDIIIQRSFMDYDTLVYKIPSNYRIETIPAGKTINSEFGDYSFSVSAKQDELTYTRSFTIKQGQYRASEYKQFYEFVLSIAKADNLKVMLVRKDHSL
jgi:hypothetical protein